MSTRAYNELWSAAQQELDDVLEKETPVTKSGHKVKKTLLALATMYVRYIIVMKKLDLCYDQMVNPQKRMVIRKLLDGTMGRMVELKHEMVAFDLCEFIAFDGVLKEMQLSHDDIVVPIPRYFLQERQTELKLRADSMDEILERYGLVDEKLGEMHELSLDEAVGMIQRMERARQGRVRARNMQDMHMRKQKTFGVGLSGKGAKGSPAEDLKLMQPNVAAIKIQKVWKGYNTWKKIQQVREQETIFLGMVPSPPSSDPALRPHHRVAHVEELRRSLQWTNEQDYWEAVDRIKEEVLHTEGIDMLENMQVEARNWFFAYKDKAGKFPDYPSDDEGGFDAALAQEIEEPQEQTPVKKSNSKKKKASKGEAKKASTGSKKPQLEGSTTSQTKSSAALSDIIAANDEFKGVWQAKLVKTDAIEDSHDETIIREAKRKEVTQELRRQVDALMRQELERLKIAVLRDKGKRGKKLIVAMKKKKKKKKPKPVKKKRKERDLTPNRSLEFLYEELVREGIIRKHPRALLQDFLGEAKYVQEQGESKAIPVIAPNLALADVRRLVTEYCILPLGSSTVHQQCPLVKSVLLVGPTGTGKTMLVNAICSEAGATLFDLSARNLIGKYPGNDGLKMLLHLVSKVGRLLQPSIILIEDADRMFMKNIPKIEKADPKRIKKGLSKMLKTMDEEDRILILGTSRTPFESDMKALGSTYNKIIMVPKPDHASRFVLWRSLIQKHGGSMTNFVDLSLLAKISDGYTSGSIAQSVSQVLTPHRVALQRRKTLQAQEFVGVLAKFEPVYKEEEDAFKAWYKRTPLVKKKIAALEPEDVRKAREKIQLKKKQDKLLESGRGDKGKGKKTKKK